MGIGAFLSEEFAKVIEQNILSTKHLLTTDSKKIEFSDQFYKFFTIDSNEIRSNVNDDTKVSIEGRLEDWYIQIDRNSIYKCEDMDDDEGYNTYIENGKFIIKNPKLGIEHEIVEKSGNEIYLTDECLQMIRKYKGVIPIIEIDNETPLFIVIIMNNELTKPLYELMHLINSDKNTEIDRNIQQISQRFVELLVESKIGASAVAAEFIINRLIRRNDDIYERPDFTSIRMPKYKIVTVSNALERNKSPLVGLSYQYLKRQLLNNDTFTKKDAPSYLDPFFMEKVSAKKRKKHIRYVEKEKREKLK